MSDQRFNPYDVLGLDTDATSDDIKIAYRSLAKKYHPDRMHISNMSDTEKRDSERLFKEINMANDTLSDTSKRAKYDMFGKVDGIDAEMDINDIVNNLFPGNDFIGNILRGGGFDPSSIPQNANATFVFNTGSPADMPGNFAEIFNNPFFHPSTQFTSPTHPTHPTQFPATHRPMQRRNYEREQELDRDDRDDQEPDQEPEPEPKPKQIDTITDNIDLTHIVKGYEKRTIEFLGTAICPKCGGTRADNPNDIIKCLACGGIGVDLFRNRCSSCSGHGKAFKTDVRCDECSPDKLDATLNNPKFADIYHLPIDHKQNGIEKGTMSCIYVKRKVTFAIRAGIPDGHIYILRNKGNTDPVTKMRNELRITVKHKLPDNVKIDGRNIIYTLDVKLGDLLKGEFATDIEPIEGESHHIEIDEYSDPDEKIVFEEFGLPQYEKKKKKGDANKIMKRGDLIVKLNVIFPKDGYDIKRYKKVFQKMFAADKS